MKIPTSLIKTSLALTAALILAESARPLADPLYLDLDSSLPSRAEVTNLCSGISLYAREEFCCKEPTRPNPAAFEYTPGMSVPVTGRKM